MVPLEGGCLCGAVRYRVTAEPVDACYCHCRMCQKTSGAPVVAWGNVPIEGFAFTKGTPISHQSSPKGIRHFCGACGTRLAFRYAEGPTTVYINLATLDDPEAIKPDYHIWTASQLGWFETADNLPRYADDGPDTSP